ncbi:hypothetical protein DPMN_109516 [Dreissena polymorpha]|uniref:Uncharacterized protein n=1 Tax=Dreissena polymorpha TaxID=45954 RepID=A0A9D4QM16_DREPO|nr:hypothetical protein DPMN_109516 [Dreissena polymorpha]
MITKDTTADTVVRILRQPLNLKEGSWELHEIVKDQLGEDNLYMSLLWENRSDFYQTRPSYGPRCTNGRHGWATTLPQPVFVCVQPPNSDKNYSSQWEHCFSFYVNDGHKMGKKDLFGHTVFFTSEKEKLLWMAALLNSQSPLGAGC